MLKEINMPFSMSKLLLKPSEKIQERVIKFKEGKEKVSQAKKNLQDIGMSGEVRDAIDILLLKKEVVIRGYNWRILIGLLSALKSNPRFYERFDYHVTTTDKLNKQTVIEDVLVYLTKKFDGVKIRRL